MLKKTNNIWTVFFSQIFTGIFAFVGAFFPLNGIGFDNEVVMAFVCANFLFIAFCDIIPELLDDKNVNFSGILLEIGGFFIGIYLV